MFLSCCKARYLFTVPKADWMLEQAADTWTPTHLSIPEVWGACVIGWVLTQHFENVGAFTSKSKESRRILSGLMALEGKWTMTLWTTRPLTQHHSILCCTTMWTSEHQHLEFCKLWCKQQNSLVAWKCGCWLLLASGNIFYGDYINL